MANRVAGITVEIGGNVGPLNKALESVNSTIKATQANLRDVERLLKLDPTNTELLAQKQENLKEKIGATKEKLDALKTAQEQAKQQMESGDLGKDKYDALQREIIATEEELKKLAKEAAEADTTLNKIGDVGSKLENAGNKMSSVGSSLTRNVTAPIVGIGTAAVKTTADFDSQMSKVSAISGATGDDFDALRAKAREMGAKTKFSATEAGQGFEYMAMAGWKTGDMLDGIEGIMNLAAASGEDLGTTSDIVTDALTAFGLGAKDSGHFADLLAKASSSANTNVSMLGESFKYAAPVAGSLGSSAEDTTLALGLMANAGIKASQAGTSLRTGLTNMVKPTDQMQAAMDRYNISLVKNKDGSINLKGTMELLRDRLGGVSQDEQAAAAAAIFGKNAMSGWLAIINASGKDFDSLSSAIDNCDGSAEEMALKMQDNLAGQITILKSALQELAIQIGDALMPTVRDIVGHIQSFVEKLQKMDEGTRNTIIKIAAFAAAIGPALIVVGKLTAGIGQGMQAFSSIGKAVLTFVNEAKLGAGMGGKLAAAISGISAPVLAVAAVTAVLAAAFMNLWKNNEEFREKVTAIWEGIKEAFAGAAEKITEAINSLGFSFSGLGEAIKAAWDWICNALAPIIEGIFTFIAEAIRGVVEVITGVVQTVCGIITGFRDGDWSLFLEGLKTLFDGFLALLLAPFAGIFTAFSETINAFKAAWEAVWSGIGAFFSGVWTGIKTTFETVFAGISTFLSGIWAGISQTAASAWNAIKEAIGGALAQIAGAISTAWQGITQTLSPLLAAFKYLFETVFQAVQILTGRAMDAVKTKVTEAWNGIKAFLSPALAAIKTAVSTAWNGIKTAVTGALNAIKGAAAPAWNGIKATIQAALNAIKTAVSTAMNAVKATLQAAWNSAKAAVSAALNGIRGTVTQVFNGIVSSIRGTMGNITSAIQQGFNGAISYIRGLISQAAGWGRDLIMGIVNGIRSCISAVAGAVTAVADKIRSVLHFSVPDEGPLTDYEKWMPDFIGGLAQGIEKSRGMIQQAVKGVAGDMVVSPAVEGSTLMAGPGAGRSDTAALTAMLGQYLPYLPQLANMKVVTDTGALVGQLAPQMDERLGVIAMRQRRQ